MLQLTRASLVSFGLVAGTLSTATAATTYTETVVHDTTTPVEVDLSSETVLCSSADYGALFLKILIPELAQLTLLDHQNFGAGAPCVASGLCVPGNMPEDIIDPYNPTETVGIRVKAVRLDEADDAAQTCNTFLVERVDVTIRGITFLHERSAPLGTRPFADCGHSSSVVDDPTDPPSDPNDTPADDPGAPDPVTPSAGGCQAGGSSPAGLLLALGAVALRRRRRRA